MNYDYGSGNTSGEADREIHQKVHYSFLNSPALKPILSYSKLATHTRSTLLISSLLLHFHLQWSIIRLLRIVVNNALVLSCPSVHPSAHINAAANGKNSLKLYTGDFYENLSSRSKFRSNRTKISDTLHWRPKYVSRLPATYVVNSPQKHCCTTLDIFLFFSDK
jgi:hypothetical protein